MGYFYDHDQPESSSALDRCGGLVVGGDIPRVFLEELQNKATEQFQDDGHGGCAACSGHA